jgi:hypothetical protein
MPVWHEKHLRAATRAAGVALWSWNVDTDAITMEDGPGQWHFAAANDPDQ